MMSSPPWATSTPIAAISTRAAPSRQRALGGLDPGGRDHLELVILQAAPEIAVAIGAAQLFWQAGEHRRIPAFRKIKIIGQSSGPAVNQRNSPGLAGRG